MNNFKNESENLHRELTRLDEDIVWSNQGKQQLQDRIRNDIRGKNNSIEKSNFHKEPSRLKNKFNFLLSISVVSIMFLGITYFVGTQLNFFSEPETKQANEPKENTMTANEEPKTGTIGNANPVEKTTVDPKEWKDISITGDLGKVDFPTNVNDWVAFQIKEFSKKPDSNLPNGEYDEGYDYYLRSQALKMTLGSYIRVEGEDLEKDFENLWALAGIISHEQFVRTAHIDPNGEAIEKTEYGKQWKPTSKRMKLSFEYMKQLLNDIDVAINKSNKGETYGVSHQLDGDKVLEMESFMSYYDGE